MKSKSGFSLAMTSHPLHFILDPICLQVGRCFINDSFTVVGTFFAGPNFPNPVNAIPPRTGRIKA